MTRYSKLIRDRIPEIIHESGKIPIVKQLTQAEHFEQALLKLYEEIKEYEETNIYDYSL